MNTKIFILHIITFLLLVNASLAQQKLLFEQVNDKNGRPFGRITGITQDKDGFLWFSSERGLYKYDGYTAKQFKHTADTMSIPYSNLSGLFYDSNNNLWIKHLGRLAASRNGQNYPISDSLTEIGFKAGFVMESDKHNLWIGSEKNGLYSYNYSTKAIKQFKSHSPTYSPHTFKFVDSLLVNVKPLGGIKKAGNDIDTIIPVHIKKDGKYLIMSTFEMNMYDQFDFGELRNSDDEIIWKATKTLAKYTGGNNDFKLQIAPIYLKKGTYYLKYTTDELNSYDNWTKPEDAPTKVNFHGVLLYSFTNMAWDDKMLNTYFPSNFISSNSINGIAFDKDSSLWILTDKGLEQYKPDIKTFKHYGINWAKLFRGNPAINFLHIDKENNFWIGTNIGLLKYSLNNDFELFANSTAKDTTLLTDNNITCMTEDKYGNFWIGTSNGINYLEPSIRKVAKYRKDKNRLLDNHIFDIYIDRSGNIWFATKLGLNKLVPPRFLFYNFDIEKRFTKYPVLIENKNSFWLRGKKNVLRNYNRATMTYRDIELSEQIFADQNKTDESYIFNQIIDGGYGKIIIGIGKGIFIINKNTGEIINEFHLKNFNVNGTEIENQISKIVKEKDNNFWLFGLDAIYQYNSTQNNVTDTIPHDGRDIIIEGADFILDYVKDDQKYWLRTITGIELFDPAKRTVELLDTFNVDIQNSSEINGNVFIDNDRNVWAMVFPELHRINKKGEIKIFQFDTEEKAGECIIYSTIDSLLWIQSTNGLLRFSKNTGKFSVFSMRSSGLVANEIYNIVGDNKNNLWLSTQKGLTKFNIISEIAKNYFTSNDFSSYEFSGNSISDISQKGEMIFFTSQGMLTYFPDSINNTAPPLAISNFTISKKEYIIDSLLNENGIINLKYDQNYISFEFSALDFTDPYSNRYAFKLVNYDEEWTATEANNRRITYNKLPPGKYTFVLRGSNNDNVWSEKEIVTILIKPPFWQTWGFRIFLLLLVGSLIWAFIKIRERKLQHDKQVLERIVKERTAEIEKQKVEIAKQRDEVVKQHDFIAKQNEEITDSIHYASRIQSAILPAKEMIDEYLPEHFILFKPRDIVSGDFYWIGYHNERIIITAADCTGHGVPGAFMSMLGVTFLNEIVIKDNIIAPNEILNCLREHVMSSLKQTGKENEAKDGMDISLCSIDLKNMKLYFSGAYNHLFFIRDNEMTIYKADKMPIGIYMIETSGFSMSEIDIRKGDVVYMSSDGYVDQFGGEKGRKFMSKRFKELLLEIHKHPAEKQKEILNKTLMDWQRGEYEQIDDIVVIGIKF